jgi:hypothetical protein
MQLGAKGHYRGQPYGTLERKFLQHHQKQKTLSPNQKLRRARQTIKGSTSAAPMVEGGGDTFSVRNRHEQNFNTTSQIHIAENTLKAKSTTTMARSLATHSVARNNNTPCHVVAHNLFAQLPKATDFCQTEPKVRDLRQTKNHKGSSDRQRRSLHQSDGQRQG